MGTNMQGLNLLQEVIATDRPPKGRFVLTYSFKFSDSYRSETAITVISEMGDSVLASCGKVVRFTILGVQLDPC